MNNKKIVFHNGRLASNGQVIAYTAATKEACDALNSIELTGAFIPEVKTVIYATDKLTKVIFADGTWTTVKRSENDAPDHGTAVVYAVWKRVYGKLNPKTMEVKLGGARAKLDKIVKAGYDPAVRAKENAKKAEEQKREAQRVQQAQKQTAEDREVEEFARILELFERASKLRAQRASEASATTADPKPVAKTFLTESAPVEQKSKKFKDMTQDEKRAYWRAQYHKNH